MSAGLFESDIPSLTRLGRGKVRDIYAVDDEHLLIVASDRLSAFDVVLPQPIPGKGEVLTRLSRFWFDTIATDVPNHLSALEVKDVLPDAAEREPLGERAMVVRRLAPLPVEAIVRGYLIGSGWKDYQATGAVSGVALPAGLQIASQLPEPVFTPSSKAEAGAHDENISFAEVESLVGSSVAARISELALRLYRRARDHAAARGIIIADTKFEFGLDAAGEVVLIDEMLTPDSSRFWPAEAHQPGVNPPAYDKQYVRDYLETLDWDKTPPAPALPPDVLARTAAKYVEAEKLLTGPATR